jgi:hypothetical protein
MALVPFVRAVAVLALAGGAVAVPTGNAAAVDFPTSYVTSPAAGSVLPLGQPATVQGIADNGESGGITSVDVSLDGGDSWQPAVAGPERWSFTFTPDQPGVLTIVSRAATAEAVEAPQRSATVTVSAAGTDVACPCALRFPATGLPPIDDPDDVPVELGLRFRTDRPGSVLGLLFLRYPDNTGPFTGHLWTADGDLLASVTLETTLDGFPYLRFAEPVPVEPDLTYVLSYYAPHGHYASTEYYFGNDVVDPPFTLPEGAGVYAYGLGGGFPDQGWHVSNYWIKPVLATTA